jgi:hypothetical protein
MPTILALVNDLFFYSKIRQTARQLGVELLPAQPERLAVQAAERSAGAVLVELGSGLESALQAVRALKADPALSAVRVVAFGSHVQTDVLEAARQAGCDEVLGRGEFTARLPEILQA